jgi:hypothetical protein
MTKMFGHFICLFHKDIKISSLNEHYELKSALMAESIQAL